MIQRFFSWRKSLEPPTLIPTDPHPAGEGLRWIAHGFQHTWLSDHEILDREFIVYDALYAECQKRVAA